MTYNPKNEHKIDIELPEHKKTIERAKVLYRSFIEEFGDKLDLRDESSVEEVYKSAEKQGIFTEAKTIRNLIFGNETTTYGVSYISDTCRSTCTYCPIRAESVDEETGKPIRRKTLNLEDFILDTQEIIKDGHSHICFLAGDGHLTTGDSEKLIAYLQAADQLEGIDEIILNITPQSTELFEKMREAVQHKSLQFRVFQETYDREIYAQKHAQPTRAGKLGPKADYDFRRESQARAMEAGFDNYGLGVLLGLNPHSLSELDMLVDHAYELNQEYGRMPARVCLPTANSLKGVNNVEQQHHVSDKANELMYALAKLAMPEVSIVSSERDTPEMLRVLDKYATNRTVDVQPSVGGNLLQAQMKGRLLQQTTTFATDPETAIKDYAERGYELIFKY